MMGVGGPGGEGGGVSRRGSIPSQKNAFCAHILCFEPGEVPFFEHTKFQSLGQKLQDKASSSFF